ncbi:3-methyl-2-oxobutanoate hydroxymethyltransferase [Coprothermobacteraceae bacterium]|nr:3-methyl-2-oxobutanoate hydroxymethyltransferase [Coprothermobacteraceae bacterium]
MNAWQFRKLKGHKKILMLTAYDYGFADALAEAGVDALLVGDSLGNVVQGNDTTLPVTLDEMIYHAKIVKRGAPNVFVVADMPFLSYQVSHEEAIRNCGRVLKESGADAVKVEGGEQIADLVYKLTQVGIPIMGHIGVTPQSSKMHGFTKRGKDTGDIDYLRRSAKALEEAGAFSLVLENITEVVAKQITESVAIPTIGIGAGPHCDGQVLVLYDFIGLTRERPPFAKNYLDLRAEIKDAVNKFRQDIMSNNIL